MWCGALLLAVQYDYAILRAVLVRFLQFDEHSYESNQDSFTSLQIRAGHF